MGRGPKYSISISVGGMLLGFSTFAANHLYQRVEADIEKLAVRVSLAENAAFTNSREIAVNTSRIAGCGCR